MNYRLITADVLDGLAQLPDESVQCVVTSPPYWGLRDYGVVGQIGLERTPDEYVARMVGVFREVRRVLRKDGTLWLNCGDSYAGSWGAQGREAHPKRASNTGSIPRGSDFKPKDLIGIPWLLAFAIRADGWWLRSEVIWHKPNPMPESTRDRPTKSHEQVFLLTRSARYYYDADAIAEAGADSSRARLAQNVGAQAGSIRTYGGTMAHRPMKAVAQHKQAALGRDLTLSSLGSNGEPLSRNKRSVWTIATEAFPGAHFATFPTALVEPCILAGSRVGDTILDPFSGSGTTGVVALSHQRDYIGIELNAAYVEMSRRRLETVAPMFATEVRA